MSQAALVVEDDPTLRMLLRMLLEDEGIEVVEAATGREALDRFDPEHCDVVLLDLRLPEVSGFDVCRSIRSASATPIIMVTAQNDSHDVVAGLESGADDYVTKPFDDRELLARVKVQLRRHVVRNETPAVMHVGEIEISASEGVVRRNGEAIALTKTEFLLLLHLAENPNRVWSRDLLLEHIWDYPWGGDGRLVDTHIRRLRSKVESDPSAPTLVQTVRGLGYKLVP